MCCGRVLHLEDFAPERCDECVENRCRDWVRKKYRVEKIPSFDDSIGVLRLYQIVKSILGPKVLLSVSQSKHSPWEREVASAAHTGIPAFVEMPAPVTTIAFFDPDTKSAIFWRSLVLGLTVMVGIVLFTSVGNVEQVR